MASVKLTIVLLLGLLLASIPGTLILQYNISSVDPGIQYDYDFWRFGRYLQLFTSYRSFWYVGLLVILAMNLIACSVERWPQMWKLANAKPVLWAKETFLRQPSELLHTWTTSGKAADVKASWLKVLKDRGIEPVFLEDEKDRFQIFWQAGRWSRVANYLVHTSLLVIFAGAILSSLRGFEGAANIPAGGAVDTFLLFNEGKASGLELAPGGLRNERLLGFRVQADDFKVKFYEKYPGRAEDFVTQMSILEEGRVVKSGTLRVNSPMAHRNFVFYQASYGRMGDFNIKLRMVDKKDPFNKQEFKQTRLGEPQEIAAAHGGGQLVAMRALPDVQGLGPGVQFQEFKAQRPTGKPFWVLRDYPAFDFARRQAAYGVVIDDVEELFYTGLQIAYDPGAPIYWTGCLGMLIGTFYALFVAHRKYYLSYDKGEVLFAGQIHRLPGQFFAAVRKLAEQLRAAVKEKA